MKTRPRWVALWLLAVVASVASAVAAPLMHRTQTVISIPEPGTDVALYSLSYKGKAFEARVTSVRLDLKSEAAADPLVGEWTFLGSNSDGQLHRVEIFVRLLDDSGTQLAVFSNTFNLNAGAHDQACKVDMKTKAADWKATKSIRIVTDWRSLSS